MGGTTNDCTWVEEEEREEEVSLRLYLCLFNLNEWQLVRPGSTHNWYVFSKSFSGHSEYSNFLLKWTSLLPLYNRSLCRPCTGFAGFTHEAWLLMSHDYRGQTRAGRGRDCAVKPINIKSTWKMAATPMLAAGNNAALKDYYSRCP